MAGRHRVDDVPTVSRSALKASPAPTSYAVTVTAGPDRGASFELSGARPQRVLLGQSPVCDIKLTDSEVSRRHAALDPGERPLRLTDLGSTNGTFVNGVRVVEAYLLGGESVRLGQTVLEISVAPRGESVPVSEATRFGRVLGASLEMRRLYPLCERLASTDVALVIEGETGTGKEVLAESLHEAGARKGGPFLVFDCASVPANLVEAELFGHERGAFTGAHATRKGLFEQAHGGTLLIDEIGELEPSLQPKLLRTIQRGEIRRVGGDRVITADVRIVAATRRDLDREVQAGRFRDDLFFRLAIARVELPPLRRRHGDVTLLAESFWKEFRGEGRLPEALLSRWESYDWPGNIRELRNEVARRAALGDLADLPRARPATKESTPEFLDETLELELPFVRARDRVLAEFQRRYLTRMVDRYGGNVSRAAEASGIAHRYFQILRARHTK